MEREPIRTKYLRMRPVRVFFLNIEIVLSSTHLQHIAAAAAGAAAGAAAQRHTRPGSASLYGRLVGATLEPFVHVRTVVLCFLGHLEIRHSLKTKKLHQPDMGPTEILVAGATATTAVRRMQRGFSVALSVAGWI